MLVQNITNCGLQVRLVNIPGDGNCLFHAISDQLTRVNEIPKTHVELRALAIETLKDPSNICVSFITVNLFFFISLFTALLSRIKALALQKRPLFVLFALVGRTTAILDVAMLCAVEGAQCKTRELP